MRRLVDLMHRRWTGLHESALLLGVTALVSQFMGFIIQRILAAKFGTGFALDIFYSAFRVPDFLYATIASFVAVTVLVPFISEVVHGRDDEREEKLSQLISTIFTAFALLMSLACAIAFVAMPYLADYLVPGFPAYQKAEWVSVARVLLLSPLLLGFSNLFGSVTQSLQRFVVFAVGPILYNVGMLLGILFYQKWDMPGLAAGVVLGAFMHMAIQIPVLLRAGLFPKISLAMKSVIPRIASLSILRTIALSATNVSTVVLTALASKTNGAVTVFTFASSLQGISHTVIGMSYSVAAFPTLSKIWAKGDKVSFRGQLLDAGRHIIFWALPIMALSIVLRAQIVRVLFGSGNFDWGATKLVAAALALFVISAVAQSLALLFTRALYAVGDTMHALVGNVVGAIVTVLAAYGLDSLFAQGGVFKYFLEVILRVEGVAGTQVLVLPLAYSVGVFVSLILLLSSVEKKTPHVWKGLRRAAYQSFATSVLMGFVAYHTLAVVEPYLDRDTFIGIALQGLAGAVAAAIAGLALHSIMENREFIEVRAAVRSKFLRKTHPIHVETEHI